MKPPTRKMNHPRMCGQHKKEALCKKYRDLSGVAQRKRRHSSFKLDVLVIIEIDKIVNQFSGLLKCGNFLPVDAFGFEDGKEIFGHCIIITISTS